MNCHWYVSCQTSDLQMTTTWSWLQYISAILYNFKTRLSLIVCLKLSRLDYYQFDIDVFDAWKTHFNQFSDQKDIKYWTDGKKRDVFAGLKYKQDFNLISLKVITKNAIERIKAQNR